MATVLHVPAFEDNYIWLIYNESGYAAIVDPGDEEPVFEALSDLELRPLAVLCTHHHYDHVGGAADLAQKYQIPVYGPGTEGIKAVTSPVQEGDVVDLPDMGIRLSVLDLPGHTRGHIGYFLDIPGEESLFCGDTLFSAGCGRLFEGSPAQLFASLQKLNHLPGSTRVYCAHEYTEANLRFAQAVEPGNPRIGQYLDHVKALRARAEPSLPSTIEQEQAINPFLRTGVADVSKAVADWAAKNTNQSIHNQADVFAMMRRWKDGFRG